MSDMPKKIWAYEEPSRGKYWLDWDYDDDPTPYVRQDLVDALVEAVKETKQDEALGFSVDWRAAIAALKALED